MDYVKPDRSVNLFICSRQATQMRKSRHRPSSCLSHKTIPVIVLILNHITKRLPTFTFFFFLLHCKCIWNYDGDIWEWARTNRMHICDQGPPKNIIHYKKKDPPSRTAWHFGVFEWIPLSMCFLSALMLSTWRFELWSHFLLVWHKLRHKLEVWLQIDNIYMNLNQFLECILECHILDPHNYVKIKSLVWLRF